MVRAGDRRRRVGHLAFDLLGRHVLPLFLLVRLGVLATIVGMFVSSVVSSSPLTTDLSAWYARSMVRTLAIVLALTVWSFRGALAGRPLWKGDLLDR
jgi:hypothetical protein